MTRVVNLIVPIWSQLFFVNHKEESRGEIILMREIYIICSYIFWPPTLVFSCPFFNICPKKSFSYALLELYFSFIWEKKHMKNIIPFSYSVHWQCLMAALACGHLPINIPEVNSFAYNRKRCFKPSVEKDSATPDHQSVIDNRCSLCVNELCLYQGNGKAEQSCFMW